MTTAVNDRSSDEGFGLIELIVAIVVAGIIMSAIVTIFVNSWKTQENVLSVSAATNRGQIVGSMIERAVRNAVHMPDPTGGVLLVRTSLVRGVPDDTAPDPASDPDDTLRCQGFAVTPEAGADPEHSGKSILRITAGASGISDNPTLWPMWEPHLHVISWDLDLTSSGAVTYAFEVETDGAPVRIAGEVKPRGVHDPAATGSAPCW